MLNKVVKYTSNLFYVLKWTIFRDNCFDFPFNVTPLAGFLRSPLGGGKPEIVVRKFSCPLFWSTIVPSHAVTTDNKDARSHHLRQESCAALCHPYITLRRCIVCQRSKSTVRNTKQRLPLGHQVTSCWRVHSSYS